ncbi:MAG: cell division protein FtsA [Bacteroidales bacterium]|nr:cell division protein FtsA [Bacteroidales bacterium]
MRLKKKKSEYPTPKIAVGLDIGTTKVVCFVGERDFESGKIKILGHGECASFGVIRGQIINLKQTCDAIKQVIKTASERSDVTIDTLTVGIAGQFINNNRQLGEIKRKDANAIITQVDVEELTNSMFKVIFQPGVQLIYPSPQEYTVDSITGIIDPIGVVGSQFSSVFNLITGASSHITNIVRCIKECGLKMECLLPEPIASAEVVINEPEKEVGVAVVDIGGGTTDIAVYTNKILRHVAVIPIGGEVITDDIRAVFAGITKEVAETVKIKHGKCLPNSAESNESITIPGINGRDPINIPIVELAKVIASRTEEIITRVVEELKSVDCFDNLGCGLVLTGGGSKLKYIKEYTEFLTGKSVRIGNPEQKIILDKESPLFHPKYATGLGLMTLSIEKEEELTSDIEEEDKTNNEKKEPKEKKSFHPWKRLTDIYEQLLADIENSEDDDDD